MRAPEILALMVLVPVTLAIPFLIVVLFKRSR